MANAVVASTQMTNFWSSTVTDAWKKFFADSIAGEWGLTYEKGLSGETVQGTDYSIADVERYYEAWVTQPGKYFLCEEKKTKRGEKMSDGL